MAAGAPEKLIFRTDQTQGTRIENVTLECTETECPIFDLYSLSVFWSALNAYLKKSKNPFPCLQGGPKNIQGTKIKNLTLSFLKRKYKN